MNDGDFSFFVLLARRESFTTTALELGISTSAVSRRLARLEERLGVQLFYRTTRRVSLTGEGEVYFAEAVRILGEINALEHSLSKAREIPKGLLRVNATLGFGRAYLAPKLSAFRQLYPEVDVQLILTDAPLNLVEEGIDLGIRFGAPALSQMVMRLLMRNRRLLCAAPSYLERHGVPENLVDLQQHNCIILRQDFDTYDVWRFDEVGGTFPSAKVRGNLSTNDGETALGWVLDGQGIMLRSEWDLAHHIRDDRLRIVLPLYTQTAHVAAIYPERHNLSAKVRAFVDYLSDELKDLRKTSPLTVPQSTPPAPTKNQPNTPASKTARTSD